jgi:hypothetical protein
MAPRKTLRKKVVAVGRVSTNPARRKGPIPRKGRITYSEAQSFLRAWAEWWIHLGANVAAVEEILHDLKPGQTLDPEAERVFRALVKMTEAQMQCAYPAHSKTAGCFAPLD